MISLSTLNFFLCSRVSLFFLLLCRCINFALWSDRNSIFLIKLNGYHYHLQWVEWMNEWNEVNCNFIICFFVFCWMRGFWDYRREKKSKISWNRVEWSKMWESVCCFVAIVMWSDLAPIFNVLFYTLHLCYFKNKQLIVKRRKKNKSRIIQFLWWCCQVIKEDDWF